jgi:cell division protein FtsZ
MGKAMMGTGEASGDDRARQAAEKAIANPLLDEISLHGAKGVLINVTGVHDLTLFELDEAANLIREKVDPDANIIIGSTLDPSMEGMMRVSVVATGIDVAQNRADLPIPRRSMAEVLTPPPPARMEEQPVAAVTAQPSFTPRQAHAAYDDLFTSAAQPEHAFTPQRREPEDHLKADMSVPGFVQRPPMSPMDLPSNPSAADFMAPRPQTPGAPSPEALARLKAAVAKTPVTAGVRPNMPATYSQPNPRTSAPSAPPKPEAERPRFGIGSLITRMAGAPETTDRAPAPRPRAPAPTGYDDEQDLSSDHEKIEIPAFLRRQAN